MRASGVSLAKIAETLAVKRSTVQMFLSRSEADPDRQAKIALKDPKPKIAPMVVPKRAQVPLIKIILVTERARARSLLKAHGIAYKAMTQSLTDEEKFQARYALEYLRVAKAGGSEIMLNGGGGTDEQGEEEKLQFEVIDPAPREQVESPTA
jgi:hypothetical protein